MSSKNKLETASVLAFERNFDISDAIFSQQNSKGEITPVLVTEKSVRGTISNRLKNAITNDPVKLDAEIEKANLQKVDVAMLDNDKEILIAEWSFKVLPFNGQPCVCNNMNYQEKLQTTTQSYITQQGFDELAKRYAINVLNGRWLWRNRMAAEKIKITVSCGKTSIVVENAKDYSLNAFDINDKAVNDLAALIESGLSGKQFVIFDVKAELQVGLGQEVYPSQELILDTGKTKSKVLYQKNNQAAMHSPDRTTKDTDDRKNGQAAMHSQKISNAIRTIDTWYDAQAAFPIAVEPYGAVTTMGHAFRQPKQKLDFYSLFDNWILKDEQPELAQQHYVIAVLIRGGVFGASGKE